MKSYKNIYSQIYDFKNLVLAYKKARKGKTKKYYVIEFEKHLIKNLLELQKELKNHSYSPKPLKKFIIRDPKTRKISKSIFRDRIVHHAIVNILEPIFEKVFIYDSYASRKKKGQHRALKRFDYFKRKVSKNGKRLNRIDNNYVLGSCFKADIKHYFGNVNHTILINLLKKKIKDNNTIWLINKILKNFNNKEKGMPLGNLTSQFFANVYLNELDYFIKHKLKAKYYIRYVDDFVILYESKKQLEIWKEQINKFLRNRLEIELHPEKSKIISLHKGISFLGFRIFYYYKLLKKSNINQIKINLNEWKKLYEKGLINSEKLIIKFEGWSAHAKHGNTFNLRNKMKMFCDVILLSDIL